MLSDFCSPIPKALFPFRTSVLWNHHIMERTTKSEKSRHPALACFSTLNCFRTSCLSGTLEKKCPLSPFAIPQL